MQMIRKNVQAMTVAYTIQKVLAFVFFSLVVRSLSASEVGIYTLALSLASLFGVFADFGISSMSVRELSGVEHISKRLSEVFSVKLFLSSLSFVALCIVGVLWYGERVQFLALLVAGCVMMFDTIQSTLFVGLRSRNDLRHESLSIIFSQCLTVVLGVVLSVVYPAPWSFIALFACSSIASTVYAYTVLLRFFSTRVEIVSPFPTILQTFHHAKAFGLASIFGRVYGILDGIILHALQGAAALGVYSVSAKIITAFQFIPYALGASLYPAFSAATIQVDEYKKREQLFIKAGAYSVAVGGSILLGIFLLSEFVVPFVFGEIYLDSVLPLQIAAFALPCTFYTFVTGALLNAVRLQWLQTGIVCSALCVNTLANIWLVPQYGAVGAASAALVSSVYWAGTSVVVLYFYKHISLLIFCRHLFIILLFLGILLCSWWISKTSIFAGVLFAVVGAIGSIVSLRIFSFRNVFGTFS